jgi:hypothetical protein
MAAVDLSATTNVPFIFSKTSIGTTWQEFLLPRWVCRVTIVGSGDAWIGLVGAETPADGGAVGTHKVGIPSDSGVVFVIRGPEGKPVIPGLQYASSIFVAAQSSTITASITLESGRQ